jgi:aspartate/tyrosine/aromatic aminotransferase
MDAKQLAKQLAKQRGSRTYHNYKNRSMNAGFTVRKYAYLH